MKDMSEKSAPNESQQTDKVQPGAHNMSAMSGSAMSGGAVSGSAMSGMEESTGAQPRLSTLTLAVVSLLSMAMLAGGLALAARYGDLSMRAGDTSMKSMQMPMQESRASQFNREHGATGNKATQDDMSGMTMPQR